MMIVIHNRHVHRAHDQHSGGVVEAGDHTRLIGREQSRHKGGDRKTVHTFNYFYLFEGIVASIF